MAAQILFKIMPRWLRRKCRRRMQVLSDLHLEVGQQYSSYTFPVTAPFLLLGGDIGRLVDYERYREFLEVQASRYEKVFWVLGNHEFYGLEYDSGVDEARRLAEEPTLDNVVVLHRARWDDANSNLTILGCTLWSAIPERAHGVVESKVSDFKKIDGWTVEKHNTVHADEISWLRQEVATIAAHKGSAARRILIATHHAPCVEGTSRPDQSSNPWTPAFATDIVDRGGWDCVSIWTFGHTHYSTDIRRNGIRVVANQRGYVLPGTTGASAFDPRMVLTL